MAKITRKEAASRANTLLEEAAESVTRAGKSTGGASRHWDEAKGHIEAALGQCNAVVCAPVDVASIPEFNKDGKVSQSLATGLRILGLFPVGEDLLLGIADIADTLKLSRSTTHRYVQSLCLFGQLEQPASAARKYRRVQIEEVE